MRRVIRQACWAACAVAVALLGATSAAAASSSAVHPATPGEQIPLSGHVFKSSNWSGYAVTSKKHHITAVKSAFTVPTPGVPTGYASNWAGIGGFTTSDLIQAGTSEFFAPKQNYFAWYELLPGPETPLHNCTGGPSCPVAAGDHMTVKIKQLSAKTKKWRISVDDATAGWSWSKTVHYASSRSSAEWILEAPQVAGKQSKLPHGLGTSFFGPTSTFTKTRSDKSTTGPIAAGNPVTIDLIAQNGTSEATPSPLAPDGQSFNACAWSSSCPTP